MSGILGEMHRFSGRINLNGKIAYAPQTAFIQNSTLRNNIVFTNKYDEDFYKHVLNLCSLYQDINMLPGGDLTEIGEKVYLIRKIVILGHSWIHGMKYTY